MINARIATGEMDPELLIARNIKPSANSIELYRRFIPIKPGLKVLDVGSGLSNGVSYLNSLGVETYGVDIAYSDKVTLDDEIRNYSGRIADDMRAEKYDPDAIEAFASCAEEAVDEFARDFKMHPERYVSATISSMPWPDNFFDHAYSVFCLTHYIDNDNNALEPMVREIMRVLKNDSVLQVMPAFNVTERNDNLLKKYASVFSYAAMSGYSRVLIAQKKIVDISHYTSDRPDLRCSV